MIYLCKNLSSYNTIETQRKRSRNNHEIHSLTHLHRNKAKEQLNHLFWREDCGCALLIETWWRKPSWLKLIGRLRAERGEINEQLHPLSWLRLWGYLSILAKRSGDLRNEWEPIRDQLGDLESGRRIHSVEEMFGWWWDIAWRYISVWVDNCWFLLPW